VGYALLLAGVTVYCLRATLTDPTDRNVIYERQCRKEGIQAEENDELEYFCDVCEAFVHDRTKHCGDCNRCSDLFDHHCKWLNNCIGGKNYVDFLVLISILLGQTIVFMLVSIVFVISAFADNSKFQEGFYKWYDTDLNRAGLIVFIVLLNVI
jgi:palmitoyltransferase